MFLSNRLFHDPANYSPENDNEMLWAVDWMPSRAPTMEVTTARSQMPPHSDVNYLRPGASENPLLVSTCSSNGDELIVDGPWTVLMEAVGWKDMGTVLMSFFTEYMGIGKPLKDGHFFWNGNPKSKFVTRKNRNPHNGKTWTTNFAIQLQMIGSLDLETMKFLMVLIGAFPFLVWNGQYAYDSSHGDFAKTFACECANKNDVQLKVAELQKARLEKYAVVEESTPVLPPPLPLVPPSQALFYPLSGSSPVVAGAFASNVSAVASCAEPAVAGRTLSAVAGCSVGNHIIDLLPPSQPWQVATRAREEAVQHANHACRWEQDKNEKLDNMLSEGLLQCEHKFVGGTADGEGIAQPCTPPALLQEVATTGVATDATPPRRAKRLSEALSPLIAKTRKINNGEGDNNDAISDFEKVKNTQMDDESDVEEIIRNKVDLSSRMDALQTQNAQILQFLQNFVVGGRAALPSSGSNTAFTVSTNGD